jgi:hypothetical protein
MNPNPNNKDNPKSAPESGDPLASGRSRGKPVDDSPTDQENERAGDELDESQAPESGRHQATRPSTRPNLGTQGV